MYEFGLDLFNGKSGVSGASVDVVSISFDWSEASQCKQPSGQPNPTCSEETLTLILTLILTLTLTLALTLTLTLTARASQWRLPQPSP